MGLLQQLSIPAKEIETDDGVMLGNELYRVYYAVPNKSVAKDSWKSGKMEIEVPPNTIHVSLISDQRYETASKIMIDMMLHEDHPISVIRERK